MAKNYEPTVSKEELLEASSTEKMRRFIIKVAYFALILGIIYVIFKYAINIILPFVIAFIVAMIAKPIITFFVKKLKFPRSIASIITVVLFYGTVGVLFVLLVVQLILAIKDWIVTLPDYYRTTLAPFISLQLDNLETWVASLGPAVDDDLVSSIASLSDNIVTKLGNIIGDAATSFVNWTVSTVTSLPSLFINIIITIISTFFMTLDYPKITAFISLQLSEKRAHTLLKIKEGLGTTLLKYIKSYALIMLMTFAEIFLGLSIIGIKNSVIIAAIIAVFDILPIVGSGMILFPWTVISLIQGNYKVALGVGILWIVVIIVRYIMEPKIVGDEVGLNPVLIFMGMIVGTYFFGGFGLLGLPVALALIKKLHDQGTIGLYNSFAPDSEFYSLKKDEGDTPSEPPAPLPPADAPAAEPPASEKPLDAIKKHVSKVTSKIARKK